MKKLIGEKLSAVFSSILALFVAWMMPLMVLMSNSVTRLSTAIQNLPGRGFVESTGHCLECHVIIMKATDVVQGRTNISQRKVINQYLELAKKVVFKECGFTIEYLQGRNREWTSSNTQKLLRNRANERRSPRTQRYFPRRRRENSCAHGSVVDIFGTKTS